MLHYIYLNYCVFTPARQPPPSNKSDEITDIGDQIEGAQDTLRNTLTQTKSQLSSIKSDVSDRDIQLKNELSQLESRLEALKVDATRVAKERDELNKSIGREEVKIRKQSNKELSTLKAELLREKKDITRNDKWELESRLQQAKLDVDPSLVALEQEKEVTPSIPSLRDTFNSIRSKFTPDIQDLQEQINAKQMFFDASFLDLRKEKKEELNGAKGVSEKEMDEEDMKLKQAKVDYTKQLLDKDVELERTLEQLDEPIELSGEAAISSALTQRDQLLQEKDAAISQQRTDWNTALSDTADAMNAIQDEYDAKYENVQRNLKRVENNDARELAKVDKKRRSRRIQLVYEREELTRSLGQLMVDEREAAKTEYQTLKRDKSATLSNNLSNIKGINNQIQTLRSNLIYVDSELKMLEDTSRKAHVRVEELEEERGSFRKQLKRTVKVAVGKIRG